MTYPINRKLLNLSFSGEIPEAMIKTTKRSFPPIFNKILDAMKLKTQYNETIRRA